VATVLNLALTPMVAGLASRAREQMGDQAYEAACADGRQWSLPQALDRTLEELTDTDQPAGTEAH